MAGVPQNFQSVSPVLPTYNFIDIASGTGYVNFYAGTTVDLRAISNFTYYSDTILDTGNLTASTPDVLLLDHDYDVLMNRPLDIRGLSILNVPVRVTGVSSEVPVIYVIAFIRKWDGASETDIVSNTSRSVSKTSGSTTIYDMLAIDLNIPLTHFKPGEYLRLTIRLYGTHPATNAATGSYAHDPLSRTTNWDSTGAVPSRLSLQLPVRLNL